MTITYKELHERVQAKIAALTQERQAQSTSVLEVRTQLDTDNRDPNTAETEQLRAAEARTQAIDEELVDARAQAEKYEREAKIWEENEARAQGVKPEHYSPIRTKDAEIYSRDSSRQGVSFFRDAFAVLEKGAFGSARERLDKYRNQVEAERHERAATTSSFAGLIPPNYLVEDYSLVAREGRPFLNSLNPNDLPEEGMSLVIPRGTTGATAAVQATENSNVSETDEVFSNLTVPVVSVAGQQDVSRQTLERGTPGIDAIIFADLAAAHAVAADGQGLNGTGSSGQALGLLQTSGVNQSTAFGAAVTAATFYKKVAGAKAAIRTTRHLAPNVIYMHPNRFSWLEAQVDSSGRPLIVPLSGGDNSAFNAMGTAGADVDPGVIPSGKFLGLPVIEDANIPTNVGANSEDVVIVARRQDAMLWQDGDGAPGELRFEQTLGNQLTVKLVSYGYLAFTAGRFPTAFAIVGGVDTTAGYGLIAPTF